MIQEAEIVRGGFFYQDGNLIGEMYIAEMGGLRHFHARNYGASAVRSYRRAMRFIKGERVLYSACEEKNSGTIRILKMLGFREEARENGAVIFCKKEP